MTQEKVVSELLPLPPSSQFAYHFKLAQQGPFDPAKHTEVKVMPALPVAFSQANLACFHIGQRSKRPNRAVKIHRSQLSPPASSEETSCPNPQNSLHTVKKDRSSRREMQTKSEWRGEQSSHFLSLSARASKMQVRKAALGTLISSPCLNSNAASRPLSFPGIILKGAMLSRKQPRAPMW